jgi:hypothetical protein
MTHPHSYTQGADAPPIWARPDPALAAAGIEGEFVVARVRLFAMALLLIAPTWNITHHPEVPIHRTGFAVTLAASVAAAVIFLMLRRGCWRPWIGFASSSFDVSMVSLALVTFLIVGSPMVALNSKVTFEMYFSAVTAASLRYDARIWWRGCLPSAGAKDATPAEYAHGAVVIDVVDARTNQLLWRGHDAADPTGDPRVTMRGLDHAVAAILDRFPGRTLALAPAG